MKHLSIGTLGAMLAVSLTASAQISTPANSTPRPQTPAQTTQRPDPEVDDDVKVTGCLRLWDSSIGALPGELWSGPRYVLLNARHDDNPGKDVVVLRRYVVTGEPSVNLAGHIEKTVRISGSVTPLGAKPEVPAPSEAPPPISDRPHPDPTWLGLSASSIDMVSATCGVSR